ncbi:MAG TPA: site-2 protease family protein, partial [Hyphomicrobiales bacterium]|nr:site-2 protease family protein [Hyphomicrobiales bacterium]
MLTLRRDLDLQEAESDDRGGRRWLLRDPLNNKFFLLGNDEIRALACIKNLALDGVKPEELAKLISRRLGKPFGQERTENLLRFLRQNNLLSAAGPQARTELLRQRDLLRPNLFKRFLREYLFLKVHLVNPGRFLEALLPWVRWLFTPTAWWLLGLNVLLGVYLTSRQFDTFITSFIGYLTFEGLLYAGVALGLVKLLHELGHALVARYYGCSVHSMGVALLIFWPVLFTDTTDAWRLKDRHQRALIAAAGILTELAIASISLTLWNFAPEGPLKMVLFMVASTTWLLTLIVNLNPLMRFDGYFLLSDLMGVENLQTRSLALARWKLREWMFGFGFEPPERPRLDMLVYAFAVMVYRFFLFLGIALIIYAYFFKLLGLMLMSVQIATTLVLPLAREIKAWWQHRKRSRLFPNVAATGLCLICALAWLVLPSQGGLLLPGYQRALESSVVYVREPGRLLRMIEKDGAQVEAGTLLVELDLGDQRYELEQVQRDIASLEAQLATQGITASLGGPRTALVAQLRSARERQAQLQVRLGDGQVVAPFNGTVKDLERDLHQQQWLGKG